MKRAPFTRVPALLLGLVGLLLGGNVSAQILVPTGSVWSYLDDGSDQGVAWRAPDFPDSGWDSGPAQLGYGDGDETTIVGYGLSSSEKHITTYFRHTFQVVDPGAVASMTLEVLRDDGAIVYLNGNEVFRSNMPSGPVDFETPAVVPVAGAAEDAFFSAYLSAALLQPGENVLAVEIHQSSPTSSDISFDLSLEGNTTFLPLEFAWSGAIEPTAARVNARIKIDSPEVRLHVSEQSDLSGARISDFEAADLWTNNRVVSFRMPGLTPGTSYHYALEVDGTLDLSKQGGFTTPVARPLSFTFAFASCASTGSVHTVFDTIRDWDPLFFLHMGDFHYENIAVNDRDLFRAAYSTVLASPTQGNLYRTTPIAYVWDDHDYGPNNSDASAPGREASRLTYQEYVPHYPLIAGSGDVPIYQAFSIGRVRFIMTDLRSERTPYLEPDSPSKTMFGVPQKDWFKQELLDATGVYPVIVWVQTMPWIGTVGDDGWYTYALERQEIANFVRDNAIEGLFMLSGDAHMLAIDDGTNSDYATGGGAGFPVMHSAALDRSGSLKGGPYSEGAFPGGGQFGLMTITDDGVSPICIDWSGRNESNTEIVAWSTCLPTVPPVDTDGDGVDDLNDCAFADPETWGRANSVTNLRVTSVNADDVGVSWADQSATAGPATVYDVVSGSLSALRAEAGFNAAACLEGAGFANLVIDGSGAPPPGEGAYYLVRAVNSCGTGGFGQTGPLDPRFALDGDRPCSLP